MPGSRPKADNRKVRGGGAAGADHLQCRQHRIAKYVARWEDVAGDKGRAERLLLVAEHLHQQDHNIPRPRGRIGGCSHLIVDRYLRRDRQILLEEGLPCGNNDASVSIAAAAQRETTARTRAGVSGAGSRVFLPSWRPRIVRPGAWYRLPAGPHTVKPCCTML